MSNNHLEGEEHSNTIVNPDNLLRLMVDDFWNDVTVYGDDIPAEKLDNYIWVAEITLHSLTEDEKFIKNFSEIRVRYFIRRMQEILDRIDSFNP